MLNTVNDLLAALRTRSVSAVELTEQAIRRIEVHDDAVNAVVVRDFERARAAAAEADDALHRGERRPLLGVPITVKEALDVAGLPTTWGVPGTEKLNAKEDAVAVQRLKAAGAVVLGKTNVPTMLADWQTANPIYGVTRNPWDLERTPGGSSGGSAAAVAAGYVPLELGSDIGGSLRIPAHCCGVFAHKPTYGLVPIRGAQPPGVPRLPTARAPDFAVLGPLARSAADLTVALDVLAGADEMNAGAYRLALPPARHARLRDFRVLVLDAHPLLPTSAEVRGALQRFAEQLSRQGCTLATSSPLLPDLADVATTFNTLLMSFFGADMPEAEYRGVQQAAARFAADDHSPAASQVRGLALTHRDWIQLDRRRAAIANQWRALFGAWDVVVCPVWPTPAFAHDHREMKQRRARIDGAEVAYEAQSAWVTLPAIADLPATVMPIGLGESGLPIGVQVIGAYLDDRTTLAFAELAEREFGGFLAPPGFAD